MRIFVKFFMNEGANFPSDYRRLFISLIKSIYRNSPFEDMVFSHERIPKPYVFSVGFKKIKSVSSESISFEPPIYFNFSSRIPQMISYVYNYFKSNSGIFGQNEVFTEISLPAPEIITSDTVTFKILGSAVLTRANTEEYYVEPEDEDFEDSLNYSLKVKMELLGNYYGRFGIKSPQFAPMKVADKSLKRTLVKHYDGFIEAFSGTLTLSSTPEMLNFVYDCGLGVRTGQGFGMVKVVKKWR